MIRSWGDSPTHTMQLWINNLSVLLPRKQIPFTITSLPSNDTNRIDSLMLRYSEKEMSFQMGNFGCIILSNIRRYAFRIGKNCLFLLLVEFHCGSLYSLQLLSWPMLLLKQEASWKVLMMSGRSCIKEFRLLDWFQSSLGKRYRIAIR